MQSNNKSVLADQKLTCLSLSDGFHRMDLLLLVLILLNLVEMAHHVDLSAIQNYVRNKCYPAEISGKKGDKANFRRDSHNFSVTDGQFSYNGKRSVFFLLFWEPGIF